MSMLCPHCGKALRLVATDEGNGRASAPTVQVSDGMATPKQARYIYSLGRDLRLSHEELERFASAYGVALADLTKTQASKVIDLLKARLDHMPGAE